MPKIDIEVVVPEMITVTLPAVRGELSLPVEHHVDQVGGPYLEILVATG